MVPKKITAEMETSKKGDNESDNKSDNLLRFPLNYYCWYEIFERVHRLQDHINLSESYDVLSEVAERIYKNRYNGIAIDFIRTLDIRRIMCHVGPFVQSLALKLSDKVNYTAENLISIQRECKQLKHLALIKFNRSNHNDHPFQDHFSDTLETLFLSSCSLGNDDNFFECFTIHKSLTMLDCETISVTAMQRCCEKNQQIESFACNSRTLDYSKFLHLLPNLKELGLTYDTKMLELNFLSTLQSLRRLALDCFVDINKALLSITLNGKINLDELELNNVVVDENTFEILATFSELRRLIIIPRRPCNFSPTCMLPPKLQTLVLHRFYICERQFNLLIEHSILDLKFSYCIYEGAMDKWIERRNKREHLKIPLNFVFSKDRPETTSTITLNDFSNSNFAFNRSRLAFPALNSSCLTDIEPEVDTYSNNTVSPFRAKLDMFARVTRKILRNTLILYSVLVVLMDLFKFL